MSRKKKHTGPQAAGPGIDQQVSMAMQLHQSGRLADAERLYTEALQRQPRHPDALHFLGVLHHQKGDNQTAASLIRKAILAHPRYADAHNNLGTVLQETGDQAGAEKAFRAAVKIDPNMAEAHYNLGNVLLEGGHPEAAVDAFGKALSLAPNHPGAHNNLGNALTELGRIGEAIGSYRAALSLAPDRAESYNNLGTALKHAGQMDDAISAYHKAITLAPDDAQTHHNLASLLTELNRIDEATRMFEKALAIDPDMAESRNQLMYQLRKVCNWDDIESLEARVLADAASGAGELTPFPLLATAASPAVQLACASGYSARKFDRYQHARVRGEFRFKKRKKDKITIGYLSYNFRECATGFLIPDLFETHDRERFNIIGYSYAPDDHSDIRRRFEASFDRFEDIIDTSFEDSARRIHADGVDILVDLKGYTQNARTEISALRPAPIQVSYLGFPGTMGASFLDYIVVDPFVVPPESAPHLSEQPIYLPDRYFPTDSKRPIAEDAPTRAERGLPENGFVFCAFNNSYKINPPIFDLWMRLLTQVPGSVLWLLAWNPHVKENLRKEAQVRGIDPARLVFADKRPNAEYLAQYRIADLFLDTIHYNGHTTVTDALWAGCPAVTCAGETIASRVAGTLLNAMGLPELVTHTLDDYEALALKLAQHPQPLAEIRTTVQNNRLSAPLFDTPRFTRQLEAAYTAIYENWLTGKSPAPVRVPPEGPASMEPS